MKSLIRSGMITSDDNNSSMARKMKKLKRQGMRKNLWKSHSVRDHPEGNSIAEVNGAKPPVSYVSTGVSTIKKTPIKSSRRRAKHKLVADFTNLDTIEDKFMMSRKAKYLDTMEDPTTFNSLNFTASTSVGHSDTMFSDSTIIGPTKNRKKVDMSWEQAVQQARGQPDGAERSFRSQKGSKKANARRAQPDPGETILEDSERQEVEGQEDTQDDNEDASKRDIERPNDVDFETEKENKNVVNTKTANKSINKSNLQQKPKKISFKTHLKKVAIKKFKNIKGGGKNKAATVSQTPIKRKLNATDGPGTPDKQQKFTDLTKHQRKNVRRLLKNNADQIKGTKKIWEELRRQNTSDERRLLLCSELMAIVKGKAKEFVYAHDTTRVLQCLIQYGSAEHKQAIFNELKDELVNMSKSKYAKFLVKKIMKYGTKLHRGFVFKALHGNVRKLIRHREAAEIVEYAYNEWANATQRLSMLEEFYGWGFVLFKDHDTKAVDDIMRTQPDKRDMIISNMKEALLPLIDKSILLYSIVHRVFLEFFMYASDRNKSEMIEALRESVVTMVHTRDGARVAMQCIWHGTPKDRKVIVKSLKTHVVKLCKEEYAHMVLLAICDAVDDTKLVVKALLEEMLVSVKELAFDQYGRKVLLYLLSPRDPLHFHPDVVKVLQEGDLNTISKKDKNVRHDELLQGVSSHLLQFVINNTQEIVLANSALLLLLSILTHTKGDPTKAMTAVADIAAEPFTAGTLNNQHIVEHSAGHMALKRLVMNDKDRMKSGEPVLFSQVLLNVLPEGRLKSWAACNRGCFILSSLVDLEHPEISEAVRKQLTGIKKSLHKMTFKGAHVLLQKLE